MNVTNLITDIKVLEGIHQISLPFKEPIENVIKQCVATASRIFSQYYSDTKEFEINYNDLVFTSEYNRERGIFKLPPELCTTRVIDVEVTAVLSGKGFGGRDDGVLTSLPTPGYACGLGVAGSYLQDMYTVQTTGAAINKYASESVKIPSGEYLGHNKVKLFNFPKNALVHFEVECDHDPSGETIEEGCEYTFTTLCRYVLGSFLYGTLKDQVNIGGGNANQTIDISKWAGYSDKLETFTAKLDENKNLGKPNSFKFF